MSTRIRYKETLNGLETEEFLAVNQMVSVLIIPNTFEVQILDSNSKKIVSYNNKNLQSAKKWAKQKLIQMGVVFSPEVRPRFKKDTKQLVTDLELLGTANEKLYKLVEDDIKMPKFEFDEDQTEGDDIV